MRVAQRAPARGWDGYRGPVVVLVHGSLDRAASFTRTASRLPEWALVAYDRRGYQGSRGAGVARSLATHVHDLLAIARVYGEAGRRPVTAVGHSAGGTIALMAAVTDPSAFSSVAAYEPPMNWLGFRGSEVAKAREPDVDPGGEAERFFRRMMGDAAWARLPEPGRTSRLADGPALVSDLAAIRGPAPFDVTALAVPALVACGGPATMPHHRLTARWLAANVGAVHLSELPGAAHGAHLSHPDAFAALVREAVALASGPAAAAGGPVP
jgi:pimeloyl-ACP methyl ester carboxylesterase